MKISLEWLREYLPEAPAADVCGDALTHGGLPVEVFEKFLGDDVFDVEVTSNRADCLSHLGVARELGALLNLRVEEVKPEVRESAAANDVKVQIEDSKLCPFYSARVIRGVKVGPSPGWMQRRLDAVGVRSINNVVDVTNYVMLEMGQPLHAFDLSKIEGREIIVRPARAGETLVSIDGHERKLSAGMLVIADARKPVALAGVMGGKDSEVSESTVDVLLEAARFDPLSVRKTARALAMKSDSSYRFERGIDVALPLRASLRAAQLMIETAGGELLSAVKQAGSAEAAEKKLVLRGEKLERVLGVKFADERILDALRRLRLNPIQSGNSFEVTVPSDRLDIHVEIDLVEEVARIVGYSEIPMREQIEIRVTPPEKNKKTVDLIREVATAAGFYEAVTFSFVSDALAGEFLPSEATGLPRADSAVRKADASLRPSLIPGLLEALRHNEANGNAGVKLFEIGSTFWLDAAGKIEERRRIGLAGGAELREMRGVIEAILARLDARRTVKVEPANILGYTPGAAAKILWGTVEVGRFGVVAKKVTDKLDLRGSATAAELELPLLLVGAQHVPQLRALPKYPSVRRDLSLVVPEALAFEKIEELIAAQRPKDLESVEFVTTYRGKPLEKGQKSVTVTLVFRSEEATLTSENVDAAVNGVVAAAKEKLGAGLRV
jgi:phenylalanyl-tRNA synthetase beta chain